VPVITQTSESTSTDSDIIQTVSYQETGVILSITPTVHASGYVDIIIDQEISLSSGDSLTPTISTRSLTTTVSLRDGGSVLLGGLISSSTENTNTGIPILGKLPFIGKLFSNDSDDQYRTELMIMVIPYILNSPDEAESLMDELQMQRIQDISADLVPQNK
jgi:general secretion pathway protein D